MTSNSIASRHIRVRAGVPLVPRSPAGRSSAGTAAEPPVDDPEDLRTVVVPAAVIPLILERVKADVRR
jgi:hypothetical protein